MMIYDVLVIGGGAAGLMAADAALHSGASVCLMESKPSLARKVLMAGKSGLNLTKDEPIEEFLEHFEGEGVKRYVKEFPPNEVRDFFDRYGADCFVGSSGKVFPKAMKASPVLRAWMTDLKNRGLVIRTKHRWVGDAPNDLRFETSDGMITQKARRVVYALGGASWPRLGSDGAWADRFPSTSLEPANMGFEVDWSEKMHPQFGQWLKNIQAQIGDKVVKGEIGITRYGVEGGLIYALSSELSDGADLVIDLMPKVELSKLQTKFEHRDKTTFPNFLRKLGLSSVARAIFFECSKTRAIEDVKALQIPILKARPLEEAISTRGGVRFEALKSDLSMQDYPNIFIAGEMLDWSAPTGGYLLNACLATGKVAGENAALA